MYVQPSSERIENPNFNSTKLNFTWEVVKITDNKTIELELDYKFPLYVSPELVPDSMVLNLHKPSFFFSKDLQKYVKEDSRTMRKPLKKQYLKNFLNRSIVGGSKKAG